MNKIYLKCFMALLFSISNGYAMKETNSRSTQKPPRINTTLITSAAKEMGKIVSYLDEGKKEEARLRIEIEDAIFESLLTEYSIEELLNSQNGKKLENKNFYVCDDISLDEVRDRSYSSIYENNIESFFQSISNEGFITMYKKGNKDDKGIEFLLKMAINDLVLSLQSFFTKEGMKRLADYLNYVGYAMQKEKKDLFDFLDQKEKKDLFDFIDQKEGGEKFCIDSCNKSQRLNSLKRKILLAFNLKSENFFAYDTVGHAHNREAILNDLASDPGNFQSGYIPSNFPEILDRFVNKGKHYFRFFYKAIEDFRYEGDFGYEYLPTAGNQYFFQTLSYFLLNDGDPNWKEGFKTQQERMKIASDFLKNCINNSERATLAGQGKQNLEGTQIVNNKCNWGCACSGTCIKNYLDMSSGNKLITQLKLSLIPAHKKAEKLFGCLPFQREFFRGILPTHQQIFFHFFWKNKGVERMGYFFQKNFPHFIQEHPELVMEDYDEKREACMTAMGIENKDDFLKEIIPIADLKYFIHLFINRVFDSLYNNYKEFEKKVMDRINQEEESLNCNRAYQDKDFQNKQ